MRAGGCFLLCSYNNYKNFMQPDFRRLFLVAGIFSLAASLALLAPNEARAGTREQLTEKSLQEVLSKERPPGPVFIAVPVAYVFGLGGDRSPAYCSPSIRVTNSAKLPVDELIVGIDYQTKDGRAAGATVTRYGKIKLDHQDTHYFYQLPVNDCRGIEGKVTVVRCIYSSGENCSGDVQAIGFGAIPLHMGPR